MADSGDYLCRIVCFWLMDCRISLALDFACLGGGLEHANVLWPQILHERLKQAEKKIA